MEHTLAHLAATAAWIFLVGFIFALIGAYATFRWIVGLFTRAEHAVEDGVNDVKHRISGDR